MDIATYRLTGQEVAPLVADSLWWNSTTRQNLPKVAKLQCALCCFVPTKGCKKKKWAALNPTHVDLGS